MTELYNIIKECNRCGLSQFRKNLVIGEGPSDTDLMFIGEAPGEEEDLLGRPFIGKAGKIFDELINYINLDRKSVYITSILKCRPPKNRNPKIDEIYNCFYWLDKQIEIINPKIICALGKYSSSTLLRNAASIDKMRGKIYNYREAKVIVTYHPAAILYNPILKEKIKEDFILLKKLR